MTVMDVIVKGIKCDNPVCDYNNDNVSYEDYAEWLNRPCPRCGENLLTEADYKTVKRMIRFAKVLNFVFSPFDLGKNKTAYNVDMNGSGGVFIKEKDGPLD